MNPWGGDDVEGGWEIGGEGGGGSYSGVKSLSVHNSSAHQAFKVQIEG